MRLSRFQGYPGMIPSRAIVAGLALLASSAAQAADPAPATARLALAERLSWGPRGDEPGMPSGDPVTALAVPINAPLPPAAAQMIAAMPISQKPMPALVMDMVDRRRQINTITDPDARAAADKAWQSDMGDFYRQVVTRDILRQLYSPAQLGEQLTWFWANHFSIHAQKREIRAMLGGWDDTLRAHALGKFRDLLAATVVQPAMLQYLDNDQNAAGHINENYAREIMELHTLGLESGGLESGGAGSAYSQKDVQELARVLTGVGVNFKREAPPRLGNLQSQYVRDGVFEFNPRRHDYGDKQFLGHTIHGRGLAELDEAITILSRHPATAHFVSKKLAMFFVGDSPSPQIVDSMAQTYLSTDGDIKAVLSTLFNSPEFAASLGKQFKDPQHYVFSALRLAYDDRPILNTQPVIGWLNRLGQPRYGHLTPDGYPLTSAAWDSPGQMTTRFEIAKSIGNGSAGLFRQDNGVDLPGFPQLSNKLYFTYLQAMLSPNTLNSLSQANSPQEWNTLLLASPEMMHR